MQTAQPTLFTRDDTMLGICQGLGEDLGFNPNWLRIALAVLLFWNPAAVIGGYLAAGVLVLFVRLVVREPRAALPQPAAPEADAAAAETVEQDEAEAVALAA